MVRFSPHLNALFLAAALLMFACKDQSTTPTDNTDVKTQSNLRPDSTIGWLYFSIAGDSVVPPTQANSTAWDIKMAYLLCCGRTQQIDVFLNSGTVGPGSVKGAMVASRFENLTTKPNPNTLVVDDTSKNGRIVPVAVIGDNIMFVYDKDVHTISPSPDRVLAIQLSNGTMVKFQFTSIYENAPASPSMFTNLGFYHFRYAKM